jgi:hypothetical protein
LAGRSWRKQARPRTSFSRRCWGDEKSTLTYIGRTRSTRLAVGEKELGRMQTKSRCRSQKSTWQSPNGLVLWMVVWKHAAMVSFKERPMYSPILSPNCQGLAHECMPIVKAKHRWWQDAAKRLLPELDRIPSLERSPQGSGCSQLHVGEQKFDCSEVLRRDCYWNSIECPSLKH